LLEDAMTRHLTRSLRVGALVLLTAALALPAYAQNGSLRGRIVDETGSGVPDVEVILDFVGPYNRQIKTITDKNGEWVRAGMPSGGGTWTITVKRGNLEGRATGIVVALNDMTRVPDVVLAPAGQKAQAAPSGMSQEEIEKRNKRQAQLEALFKESNAAFDAGNYDEAIAKLTSLATEVASCASCYAKLGDAYLKKNDLENAEKSYLKAVSLDEKAPGPYNALATIYNEQRKLDEAAKMSAKAAELLDAGGGGADAATLYNSGIIFWNQGKAVEAQAFFEKAIKADPKMADAYYFLGMALVNQNKLKEAKAPFEEYLKLDPKGQHAETAKAILATIK
jgi:tetratricopeptide (TPR) repeat protein